jgi:hypothetical protein
MQRLDRTVQRMLYLPPSSSADAARIVQTMRRLSPAAEWVLVCHAQQEQARVRVPVIQVQAPHAVAAWSEAMRRIDAHRAVISTIESAAFARGSADRLVDLHNRSLATVTVVLNQPAAPLVLERDLAEWLCIQEEHECREARDIVALAGRLIGTLVPARLPVHVRIAAMDATQLR